MDSPASSKEKARVHLLTMLVGERFTIGAQADAAIFTLVEVCVLDKSGQPRATIKARDPGGVDHHLIEVYLGNGDSYSVLPVGPIAPAAEGGGL